MPILKRNGVWAVTLFTTKSTSTQQHGTGAEPSPFCESQVSLDVLGSVLLVIVFTLPASPGQTTRELYFIAWSTPRPFMAIGGGLLAAAGSLHVIAGPLKRRWAPALRGWIT